MGEEGRGAENIMVEQTQPETKPIVPSGVATYGASGDYGIWVKKDIDSIEFTETQIEAIKAWLKHEKAKLQPEDAS